MLCNDHVSFVNWSLHQNWRDIRYIILVVRNRTRKILNSLNFRSRRSLKFWKILNFERKISKIQILGNFKFLGKWKLQRNFQNRKSFKEISRFQEIERREEFLNFGEFKISNFEKRDRNFPISEVKNFQILRFECKKKKKERKKVSKVCYKHGMHNRKGWNRYRVRVTRGDIGNRYLVGGQHLSMPLSASHRGVIPVRDVV